MIQAAAGLDPANRALLNLWMARGLPDSELAALAGVEPGAITSRKLDIVEALSTRLDVPPYAIVAGLSSARALRTSPRPRTPARPPARPRVARPVRRQPHRVPRLPALAPGDALPPVPAVRFRSGLKPLAATASRRSSARGGLSAHRERHAPAWLRALPAPAA